jgi:hypothetical protein
VTEGDRSSESGDQEGAIAVYQGSVHAWWRASGYGSRETISGEMAIYPDRLKFSGAGLQRFRFRDHVISRGDIERVCSTGEVADPWYRMFFVPDIPGVRVIGRPDDVFGERDEYLLQFFSPSVPEVLAALRDAGYPVGGLTKVSVVSVRAICNIRIMVGDFARAIGPCDMEVYSDCLRFFAFVIGTAKNGFRLQRERVEIIYPLTMPGFLPLISRRAYAIRVVSKPASSFHDRDRYDMAFNSPSETGLLDILEAAGYPVERERRRWRPWGEERKASGDSSPSITSGFAQAKHEPPRRVCGSGHRWPRSRRHRRP